MKARNFRYVRPTCISDAYRILAENAGEALPLAGGQSLLATLNLRLSAPELLVDIGDLKELVGLYYENGHLRLGALTKHRELLESDLVKMHAPLLACAAAHIGHVAIRNRGTLGGSIAYADPAAELPACAVALGASFEIGGVHGQRIVKAEDFFKGLFETDLRTGELITAIRIPGHQAGARIAFAELARRHGDFPLLGLAAMAMVNGGRIASARLVFFGLVDHAKLAVSLSSVVEGARIPLDERQPLRAAIEKDLPMEDTPGLRADTKLHLATVLARRVLNSFGGDAAR
jgi:carbon-monoxide dehydrogenase medium subunit